MEGSFYCPIERGGDVAKSKGAPQNLDPVRTKEEARRRGRNGGIKSGETRRKKRDAKQAVKLLLDMAASENLEKNLKKLGYEECDLTNMNALMARMFTEAMTGNVNAFKALMDYGGFHPDQKLKDKEREVRIDRLQNPDKYATVNPLDLLDDEEGETEDVVIYLPENGRD